MILLLCAEERGGTTFSGKRVSRDKAVTERILSLTEGKKIHLTPYSAKLFPESECLTVSEKPEEKALSGEFLFAESDFPKEGVEEIRLFRWKRRYPFDESFDPASLGFIKTEETAFAGNSHEKIVEEIWIKK